MSKKLNADACTVPSGYLSSPLGKYYKLSTDLVPYAQAEENCAKDHAWLTMPKTAAESGQFTSIALGKETQITELKQQC